MADEPKLIVALEARLDKFEKQMREAGLIAQREMKAIEDRTSQITIGTAAGNLIGKGIEAAIKGAIDSIKEAIDLMKELGATANKTALSFADIQRIGFAAALKGIDQSDTLKGLNAIGARLDEMNRRETELGGFLDANNVKYKERNGLVVNVNKGLELAATLMARAGSEFEKVEIARLFGLTEQWVKVLGQGVDEFRKLKAGANIDPDLERNVRATEGLFRIIKAITAEFQNWGHAISNYVLEPLASALQMVADFTRYVAEVNKGGVIGDVTENAAKRWAAIAKAAKEAVDNVNRTRLTVAPGPSKNIFDTGDGSKDALDRQNEQLSKAIALTQAELALVGQGVAKQEEARQVALLTEAAKRAGLDADTAVTAQMREQAAIAGALKQKLVERNAAWNEMLSMSKELGSTLSDAMKDLVLNGKKFDEVLKNIANRLASKSFDKLFDVIFAPSAGGTGSLFTQLLGLKPMMAGGPVSAGGSYMVGERGPELFVPNRSGMIVPNTALGGARGGGNTINLGATAIRIEGSADERTLQAMQAMLAARDKRFVADVATATRELRRRSVRT